MRRAVVLGAALLLAALLGWWTWATDTGRIGSARVLLRPPGTEVVLSLMRVLAVEGDRRYVVGSATLRIPVEGPTAGLAPGAELTVGGVVREGRVEERWRAAAPGRAGKKRLGFLGLGLAAAAAAATVRVGPRGLSYRG